MGRTGRGRSAPAHLGYCDGDEGGPRRRLRADPFGLRAHPLRPPRQRDQPGTRALEAGGPLSWGEGLALTADRDMLADEPEPSRAPNHLPSRHDDGAATAELHQVKFLIGGTQQHEVRDPEVEHQRPLSFLSRITWSRSGRLSSDGLSNLDHGGYGQVAHHRPHVEVSEDYYAIFASNRSGQPEHHLMRAVLEHAIRAAQNDSKGSRALRERREAVAWIMDLDRSRLFSFENVCETLPINVRWLRAKLLARTPPGGMPPRGANL